MVGDMGSEKPFLSFVIDPEFLKRLDDFRFKHRFESRAAAIKWLSGLGVKSKALWSAIRESLTVGTFTSRSYRYSMDLYCLWKKGRMAS